MTRSRHFFSGFRTASREVIRSVTHLVLARRAARSFFNPIHRTERSGPVPPTVPGSLRLVCLGPLIFTLLELTCFKPTHAAHTAPNPPVGESRKRSVPDRVHSVPKESWFARAKPHARVQPVFDSRHGRITCKAFLRLQLFWARKAAVSNQFQGLKVQPLSLADGCSPNHAAAFTASSGNIRL